MELGSDRYRPAANAEYETSLIGNRGNLEKVTWLLKAIDDIAAYRNIAVHLPIEFDECEGRATLTHATDGCGAFQR
jgi:hypothetical protein